METPSHAFAYFTVVPEREEERTRPWPLQPRQIAGPDSAAGLLFGREPTVEISDAGLPENSGGGRPWVTRSRFTIRGSGQTAYFHLDRAIMNVLCPGDEVHIAQTELRGIGFSVLRQQQLVVAAGAITAVPLGNGIQARIAPELWGRAIDAIPPPVGVPLNPQARATKNWNPAEELANQWPVELRIGAQTFLFFGGGKKMERFEIFAEHGFFFRGPARIRFGQRLIQLRSLEGKKDECVAIARIGQCSGVTANASASLLSADGLLFEAPA